MLIDSDLNFIRKPFYEYSLSSEYKINDYKGSIRNFYYPSN